MVYGSWVCPLLNRVGGSLLVQSTIAGDRDRYPNQQAGVDWHKLKLGG